VPEGGIGTESRHAQLFAGSVRGGELIPAHIPDAAMVRATLFRAAHANGYVAKYGEMAALQVIDDGIKKGLANPTASAERVPRNGTRHAKPEEPEYLRENDPPPIADETIDLRRFGGAEPPDEIPDAAPFDPLEDAPALPAVCWRPLFAECRDAFAGTTEAPDAYHFAAAWIATASMIGRGACKGTPGDTSREYGNVYAAVVGPSGKNRKTSAFWEAKYLIGKLDEAVVSINGVGSGAALVEALAPTVGEHGEDDRIKVLTRGTRTRAVLYAGELSIQLMKARGDGGADIIPRLLDAYDCPDVIENRTRQRPVRAVEPFLCLFGSTTTDGLRREFTAADVAGGLVGRIAFFTGHRKAPIPERPPADGRALDATKALLLDVRTRTQVEQGYSFSLDALALWRDWYVAEYNRQETNPVLATIGARLHTHAMKLALAFAVIEGAPEITRDQVAAAIAFAGYQRQAQAYLFGDFGDTDRGRLERRIVETLARKPMATWALRTQIRSADAEILARVLAALGKVGEIHEDQAPPPAKRGKAWHLRTCACEVCSARRSKVSARNRQGGKR
jgi:hypothetical protein